MLDPEVDINWHCTQSVRSGGNRRRVSSAHEVILLCAQYGATPLIAAISNGHSEIVEILLKADAELGVLKTPSVEACWPFC